MSNDTKQVLFEYFESAVKVLTFAAFGLLFKMSLDINNILNIQNNQSKEIDLLKNKVAYLESSTVTKAEMLETMKRVEQQMEIIILRSKVEKNESGKKAN